MKDKKYRKVKDHCNYTGEYRGAACSISKLKISVPKKIPIFLHNGSNYYYCFIITKLGEEFKKPLTCLEENTKKHITFTVSIEKKVTKIDKNGKEITKIYLTYYNFLAVQNLWQAHHKILSIVFVKEFIELQM